MLTDLPASVNRVNTESRFDNGKNPELTSRQTLVGLIQTQPAAVLTVIGLITYGILRAVYGLFYARLGVAPEEVGLGYVDTLEQSVVGLVIVALISAAGGLIALWVSFVLGRKLFAIGHHFGARLQAWSYLGLTFLAPMVLLALSVKYRSLEILVAIVPLWIFMLSRGYAAARNGTPTEEDVTLRVFVRQRQRFIPFFVASVVRPLLITTPLYAWVLGTDAREGRSVEGLSWVLPILTLRAERAEVAWAGSPPPLWFTSVSGHCLMYLGQSNGVTVLYDVRSRSSIRAPTVSLVVTVLSPPANCS